MTPDRSPAEPLWSLFRAIPFLPLILLAIPFVAPALTEMLVTPWLPMTRPLPGGQDPDNEPLTSTLAALKLENAQLKNLLQALGREEDDPLQSVGILARNLGQAPELFRHSLILDAGENQGVLHNGVAVHAGSLIGLVAARRAGWSRLTLLADPSVRVAVDILAPDDRPSPAEGWIRALAGGSNPALGSLTVQLHDVPAARRGDLRLGDLVVTNGRDFRAPPGLLVGRISSIEEEGLFLKIFLTTPDPAEISLLRLLAAPENPFRSESP